MATTNTHPLQWSDTELKYLISTGLNATNLYRAMGNTGKRPSSDFMARIYRLGYGKEKLDKA